MDDVRKTRGRYEEAVSKFRSKVPEIADIPISIAPETWMANVAERFHQRQMTKTFAAQTEMLTEVKRFFGEWRAALDAEDELKRAKPTYVEKDEEAELRELERNKRRLLLEKEIAELKKQPEPAVAPDKRPREEIKIERLANTRRRQAEAVAACNGDNEQIGEVNRLFEDLRMRIMEE